MSVGRNQRRRGAYIARAQEALDQVPNQGDQHQVFEIEVCDGVQPFADKTFVAVGYHDVLSRLVEKIVHLGPGHSVTVSLPETLSGQRALRAQLREELGLTGSEYLHPKMVPHDA